MRRVVTGCLLAGAMTAQLGPTTTDRAVDQIKSSTMRGVPAPPAPRAPRPDMIWVPDRYVSAPGHPNGVFVPGHWVPVASDGRAMPPPQTGTVPGTGAVETLPRQTP